MESEPREGRRRVVIENVQPSVDAGRFPIKRTKSQHVEVTADAFADGHDLVSCALLHRKQGEAEWQSTPLEALGNDAWRACFDVEELGVYEYTVEGWIDAFGSWLRDLKKRLEVQQDVSVDRKIGRELLAAAVERAKEAAARGRTKKGDSDLADLGQWNERLDDPKVNLAEALGGGQDEALAQLAARYPDKSMATRYDTVFSVVVDRERARFSSWYEMFPRSCSPEPGQHGTFRDVIARLPYVQSMGFDVLYLPPIHPVGTSFRKGKNNALVAKPGEPGSPWAIGSSEGGHKSINPELGTAKDFRDLIAAAKKHEMEIALDIAFQCSPEHPYVREHPEWFRKRPDGTIQYAENPPKKYQDIYPFDFETKAWRPLWEELASIFLHWASEGVRVFRVDNPHTKAFPFWEWALTKVKAEYPDTIFLSEAFTRPKVMYRLAKLGFSQSYTYFTWRNHKHEFIEYFTELTSTKLQEFFRPNLWPNTPDILPDHLQTGGRAAFLARVVMAGTLGANYGIYGPAFELMECEPREPGSEEYLNSEKYEIRTWDLDRKDSLQGTLRRLNAARQENPALKANLDLAFHAIDNDRLLAYTKYSREFKNLVLVVVNLDFHEKQAGYLTLPLAELGLNPDRPYTVRDALSGSEFRWQGARNYVELDPQVTPAHLMIVEQ